MAEKNLAGNSTEGLSVGGIAGQKTGGGMPPKMGAVTGGSGALSSIMGLVSALEKAVTLFKQLDQVYTKFSQSHHATTISSGFERTANALTKTNKAVDGTMRAADAAGSGGGGGLPRFEAPKVKDNPLPRISAVTASATPSTISGEKAVGAQLGSKVGNLMSQQMDDMNPTKGGISGLLSKNPVSLILGAVDKIQQLFGAITEAGFQYTQNRIEGPTGNRQAMMDVSQALRPQATMMGFGMNEMVRALAKKTPVEGSMTDVLQTIQAGSSVGAQLSGTNQRSGFFQGVREMQGLTPGVGAGQLAQTLAGYTGNVSAQQKGAYLGGGAFTMVGQGGKYKSLSEWAEGITKFLQEQRPGGKRGTPFTKQELLAQNFPGSNVDAWFEQMGVPQNMQDYWWQYIMTKTQAGAAGDSPFNIIEASRSQRGIDLSQERVRNVAQSTRREFLMGTQMYQMYAGRESADRRFNVGMQQTDLAIGQMMSQSNIGVALSLLPTPIADILAPILAKYASNPVGSFASIMGHLFSDKDMPGMTDQNQAPPGDVAGPSMVGDWGQFGGSSTSGLSPDLAQRISRMQKANPKVSVTSGMRDTVTQNRLQKAGVGRVGPATRSQHTRGWAADLGPRSQMKWIQENAHKFGLQTAAHLGEPWHVQRAGTMPQKYGDPRNGRMGDIGDVMIGDNPFSAAWNKMKNNPMDMFMGMMNPMKGLQDLTAGAAGLSPVTSGLEIWEDLINKFIAGGSLTEMIDKATSLYSQVMTFPMAGLAKLFGQSKFMVNDQSLAELINKKGSFEVNVNEYAGFKPQQLALNEVAGTREFGDPGYSPIGDIRARMPTGGGLNSMASFQPIVFNNTFVLPQGGAGGADKSPETRRSVASISGQIERQLTTAAERTH